MPGLCARHGGLSQLLICNMAAYRRRYYRRRPTTRRRFYKRRTYRKRRSFTRKSPSYYRRRSMRHLWRNPIPQNALLKFVYHQTHFTMNLATPTYFDYDSWTGNNLYDPSYTYVGNQPYGYDQYNGIFTHNNVVASKIKVTCQATAFSGVGVYPVYQLYIFASTNDTVTDATSVLNYQNYPAVCAWKNCDTVPRNKEILRKYCTTQQVQGHSYNDALNWAVWGSSVPTNWYWHVFASSAPSSVGTIDLAIDVKITYYAKCKNEYDPLNPS